MNISNFIFNEKYASKIIEVYKDVFDVSSIGDDRYQASSIVRPIFHLPIRHGNYFMSRGLFEVNNKEIVCMLGYTNLDYFLKKYSFSVLKNYTDIIPEYESKYNVKVEVGLNLADTIFTTNRDLDAKVMCIDIFALSKYAVKNEVSIHECLEELKCDIDVRISNTVDKDVAYSSMKLMNKCLFTTIMCDKVKGCSKLFNYDDHFRHFSYAIQNRLNDVYSIGYVIKGLNYSGVLDTSSMAGLMYEFKQARAEITPQTKANIRKSVSQLQIADTKKSANSIVNDPGI